MSTVLMIAGSPVAVPTDVILGKLVAFSAGSYSSLSFFSRAVALPGLPDPYLGKTVSLTVNGTTYFTGDVTHGPDAQYDDRWGWVLGYQCMGLRNRADWVPHTDSNTGTDTSGFNLQPEDPGFIPSRAGRTVGQILTACLTMTANAVALSSYGIGNYTGLPSAPVLPAATVADLAALTIIPPAPCYFQGGKLGSAIEGFLAGWAWNALFHIQPDGTMRFLDQRTFTNHTFTLDSDPIEPTPLHRTCSENFQRVIVRGGPLNLGLMLDTLHGGIVETFAHTGLTNAQAKAAWHASDFTTPTFADEGACTCPSTNQVTITSNDVTRNFPANFWDQTSTGTKGVVYVQYGLGTGITQFYAARVVSNTAMVAGGTATLTIDSVLPITAYDTYRLVGTASGASNVWRLHTIANAAIGAALTNQFAYPQPFRLAAGNAVTMSSAPMGSVVSASGSEATCAFTSDPSSGTILYSQPTFTVAGGSTPGNVRALVGVNVGANTATFPADILGVPQYAGTSHSVEGLTKTLTLSIDAWRDPVNQANMIQYASDVLDSIKDTIVEGSVRYLGLYEPALTMGTAVSVTGSTFTTGWEGLSLPVTEVELEWPQTEGVNYITTIHCANRRAQLSAAAFLRPDRLGLSLAGGQSYNPFGVSTASSITAASNGQVTAGKEGGTEYTQPPSDSGGAL